MLGGSVGRGIPGGRGGLRKWRLQEFGASTPYKDICSASQWAAGAALSSVPDRPPVPRRVCRSCHELHAVQQGPILRALGRGQEPGEWARTQPGAGRSLERTDASGVALLRLPRAGGARVNRGAVGSGRGTHFTAPGVLLQPRPWTSRTPAPGVFRVPSEMEGCKQDPRKGERAGVWEERPPRPRLQHLPTLPFLPPFEPFKLGTGRGRDRGLLNRVCLPSPLLGLPTRTPGRGITGGGSRAQRDIEVTSVRGMDTQQGVLI